MHPSLRCAVALPLAACTQLIGIDPGHRPADASTDDATPLPESAAPDAPLDAGVDGDATSPGCMYTVCDGACVETANNADHCGRCGHDCQGGQCSGGQCQPFAFARTGRPDLLALTATGVYWTDLGDASTTATWIFGQALDGGDLRLIASNSDWTRGLAADDSYVYWTEDVSGAVRKASIDGGAPTPVATGRNAPEAVAVDSSYVYWTEQTQIAKAPLDGGMPTVVVGNQTPSELAVDSNNVYWADGSGSIRKASLDGGSLDAGPIILAGQVASPSGIAIDGYNVYYANALAQGTISSVNFYGGFPTVIASNQNTPQWVAVDDVYVYWTTGSCGNNAVMKALKSGVGQPIWIADDPFPDRIAVDRTSIYWTDYRALMKVAK